MVLKRRTALTGMASVTAGVLAGCAMPARLGASRGARTEVGLADITIMPELLRDYAGTLRQVAAMGYTAMSFRLRGYGGQEPGEPTPREKARLVREAGLSFDIVGLGVRNVDYDRDFAEAAEIGARIVVMTTAPPFIAGPKLFETTRAKFDAWLPELATLGEKARSHGLTLAYHNHWYDLLPLGGERPLDIMARHVPAELLSFEIDLAWTWYAGVAPLNLLAQFGPRVVSMHWKDIDRGRGTSHSEQTVAPGQGEMNYAALLPHVRRLTSAMGYVEVDDPADGLAAAATGLRTVRKALG